jgi:hypothetical protein
MPISTDLYLPALSTITRDLNVSPGAAQFTMAVLGSEPARCVGLSEATMYKTFDLNIRPLVATINLFWSLCWEGISLNKRTVDK